MTVYELMLKVKDELEKRGFECESAKYKDAPDYIHDGYARRDGKLRLINERIITCYDGRQVTAYDKDGYEITFLVVHRSNGTEANISVDIALNKCATWRVIREAKERVNIHMGEKAIIKRINKIVEAFEAV